MQFFNKNKYMFSLFYFYRLLNDTIYDNEPRDFVSDFVSFNFALSRFSQKNIRFRIQMFVHSFFFCKTGNTFLFLFNGIFQFACMSMLKLWKPARIYRDNHCRLARRYIVDFFRGLAAHVRVGGRVIIETRYRGGFVLKLGRQCYTRRKRQTRIFNATDIQIWNEIVLRHIIDAILYVDISI